jgi:hypothetical protein
MITFKQVIVFFIHIPIAKQSLVVCAHLHFQFQFFFFIKIRENIIDAMQSCLLLNLHYFKYSEIQLGIILSNKTKIKSYWNKQVQNDFFSKLT